MILAYCEKHIFSAASSQNDTGKYSQHQESDTGKNQKPSLDTTGIVGILRPEGVDGVDLDLAIFCRDSNRHLHGAARYQIRAIDIDRCFGSRNHADHKPLGISVVKLLRICKIGDSLWTAVPNSNAKRFYDPADWPAYHFDQLQDNP